jgi:hypothetical protein
VVGLALCHRGQHVALACAEPVERPIALTAPEHAPHDLRVQRTAASRDPVDRVDKALDITDTLFEQVADPLSTLPDQVQSVALLVELGQHQHTGLGPLAPQLDRRAQTVVPVARRHVHIGDHDRRAVRETLAQEIRGIAGLGDHVEASFGEQSHDPLAQQDIVLADHHPQRA